MTTAPVRPAFALLCAATLLLASPALSSAAPVKTFSIASGGLNVRGDEQVCFRLTDTRYRTDRLIVRVRFVGPIPNGRLSLDGTRSAPFMRASEEIPFDVDPRGTHRLRLEFGGPATIDQLTITSTETTIEQASCASYDAETQPRADIVTNTPPPQSAFETPEERAERERRAGTTAPAPPPATTTSTPAATAPAPAPAPAPAVSRGRLGTIPAGTELTLTLQNAVDTRSAYAGQIFTTYLSHDVLVGGRVLLPEGTRVEGTVVESKDAGRFGRSSLTLGFGRAMLADGSSVVLQGTVQRVGKGSAKKQGGIIAGSAAGGAVLGSILGGKDEALLGAVLGGAIAAGAIGAKPGESITLPAGTVLAVSVDSSVDIPTPAPAPTPPTTTR